MPGRRDDEIHRDERKPPEASRKPDVQAHRNIEAIARLEKKAIHRRSAAEQLADKVTGLAGSMPFIILHVVWFGGWIAVNAELIPGLAPFDEFPFSFLTLVVSLEAIFLSLLVLMSQNRMIKESDKRAHLDLQLNMLAEQEATMVLRMVHRIGKHLGLDEEIDEGARHLEQKTDVDQLAKKLEDRLPDSAEH